VKIKEVSEKTELTERAIRLYIENGLVAPSVNESYSGRRNVDFSSEDVERLRSISVLRKAGFSISQIKLMQQEPEKSKEVLQEFIDKTNKRVATDSEIVACLIPLLSCENLSPEQISQSLDKPVVEEKVLPPEDSEPSALQKFIRKLFFALGVVGLVLGIICSVIFLRVEIRDLKGYLYPQYGLSGVMLYIWLFASLLLSAVIILLNRKKSLRTGKGRKIKAVISLVLVCVCGYFTIYNCALAFFTRLRYYPQSYVISRTYDTENYMVLDVTEARDVLLEFMPAEIPDIKGVQYRYYYKELGVWSEPAVTEVSLEIPLSEEDFLKTVEHYKSFRPSDSVCEPYEEERNDWTVVYYRENFEHAPTNYTPIFAFNEEENTVRLMCHYGRVSMKGAINAIGDFDYEW